MILNVSFQEEETFKARFVQYECTFRPTFGEVITIQNNDTYDGDYNVIPRVYQQILPTKDKLMRDDVTVEIIPLAKVKNIKNGYTVTIG